jgi:hypothetical protein
MSGWWSLLVRLTDGFNYRIASKRSRSAAFPSSIIAAGFVHRPEIS